MTDPTAELAEIIGPRRASEAMDALAVIAERLRGEHPNVRMVLVFDGCNPAEWGKAITRTRISDGDIDPSNQTEQTNPSQTDETNPE
ncbi:MAG: hypothetical protein ACR2K1_05720 [Saprospiraceae bacterium]